MVLVVLLVDVANQKTGGNAILRTVHVGPPLGRACEMICPVT